jgi:autoinducer 2-degrading protein
MIVTCVSVHVKQAHIRDFIEAAKTNHKASIQEAGNLRFDVLQMDDDPTKFLLYEAYESADAAALHKETAHYKAWREKVADWMAEPRSGIKYSAICPGEEY